MKYNIISLSGGKDSTALLLMMLEMDKSIQVNRGFKGYKTVHDLEKRFANEDKIDKQIINFCKPKGAL